MHVKLTIP